MVEALFMTSESSVRKRLWKGANNLVKKVTPLFVRRIAGDQLIETSIIDMQESALGFRQVV